MCRSISWKLLCAYGILFLILTLNFTILWREPLSCTDRTSIYFRELLNKIEGSTDRNRKVSTSRDFVGEQLNLARNWPLQHRYTCTCSARQIRMDRYTQRKRKTEKDPIDFSHRKAIGRNDPVASVAFGNETWSRTSASAKSVWRGWVSCLR